MTQDKIYNVELPDGRGFYFIVDATTTGIVIFISSEEPSKQTEAKDVEAIVRLDVETSDTRRVLARLWDDKTEKEGDPLQVITIIEQEPTDNHDN